MKKLLGGLSAVALVAALAVPSFAADETTITGQVVDVVCTMKDKANAGEDHLACATSCARRGQPVGIITDDAIYTITGDYAADKNARLIEYLAKKVTVTGTVTEKDGAKTIDVSSIALAK